MHSRWYRWRRRWTWPRTAASARCAWPWAAWRTSPGAIPTPKRSWWANRPRPSFGSLTDALLQGAQPQGNNAFKLPLARRAIVRALDVAREGTIDNRGRTSALEEAP